MCRDNFARRVPVLCTLPLLAVFPQRPTADSTFIQINLVLYVMGRAENYDPNLKDPWGSIRFFGRWIFGRAERTTIQMRSISPRVTTITIEFSGSGTASAEAKAAGVKKANSSINRRGEFS